MMSNKKEKVNILLGSNGPSSLARLAALYANGLIERGFDVIISYPMESWYRYYLYKLKKTKYSLDCAPSTGMLSFRIE
jgi:hypothetical protein